MVAEKAKLKEKIMILKSYRMAKAVTRFINAMQTYNKEKQYNLIKGTFTFCYSDPFNLEYHLGNTYIILEILHHVIHLSLKLTAVLPDLLI
ncbi:hypothetical protein, partial [Chryseobacterium joostei]|uniref:hypothetical protein n=1 Tax=Chryseobacterium joostei TaxID=112234 RepID=UPI0023F4929E